MTHSFLSISANDLVQVTGGKQVQPDDSGSDGAAAGEQIGNPDDGRLRNGSLGGRFGAGVGSLGGETSSPVVGR